jgi:two-component system chemotaxis response regulator CheY
MAYDFSNLRVLVVDDNRFMRETIEAILDSIGIGTVYHAQNAEEGFAMTRDRQPDVIVSDWDMEPGDGITLVKWLRSNQDSPDRYIPIIMLTGFSERNRVMEARDSGVTEFLAKPVSTKSMHARLMSIIDQPRPFIRTDHYFGPDRRRRANSKYKGRERRQNKDVFLI